MKYSLSLFFVLLFAASSVQAFNGNYPTPNQNIEHPAKTIQNALLKLQKFGISKNNTGSPQLLAFIKTEILPHFAFDQMTYWIAGPYAWRMSAADLTQLSVRVKQTFLTSMGTHLGSYDSNSARVTIRPVQSRGRNQVNVTAFISRPNQRPDRLDFRMKLQSNSWKIIDVKANGTSAALYYRKHFISTLRQYR